jgi:methionyl-tRNA synthetase
MNTPFSTPQYFTDHARTLLPLLVLVILWSLIWKGLALWRAGRNNQPAWFLVFLLVNSLGILEIIYLAFLGNDKKS